MIQKILEAAVMSGDVAGVVAAVTRADGTKMLAKAGVAVAGGDRLVDEDTIFWIASMTKPVTSIAAMQLVERGLLALDAPIGDVLPFLARPQILEEGRLRPAKTPITLRHLLTHTAGFSYDFASTEYVAYMQAHPETAKRGRLGWLEMPLLFEPGTEWAYGINTDWVGRAVEAASGMTLDAYFRAHILDPLGMADTQFVPSPAQDERRAAIHQRQADGTLAAAPIMPVNPGAFCSGGGGLYSTVADYQKFLAIFLHGGGGIISPASLAEMTRNQIGALRAGYIPSANPELITGADMNPGQESKWGLGFLIYPERGPFGRNAGSLGWAGLANTYFWIDPAAGHAAVIMMQILPSGDMGAVKTLCGFETAVYAKAC
ncbi:MAG: serine hydrolase [Acidocella sp.]|nr:serine hydrolase [Acidocella sp.]